MTKSEQIDGLTSVLWEANHKRSVLDYRWLATEAYNAGYRKVEYGEWVYDAENECFMCSICEKSALNNYRMLSVNSDFCPHCGARMDGDKEVRNNDEE